MPKLLTYKPFLQLIKRLFSNQFKTGKCLTIEEDCKSSGFGAEVSALIGEECFDYLDAPVRRIAAADVPVPSQLLLNLKLSRCG